MVKVKGTLVQALRLCTGSTAHRGSRCIALPFHDHGTKRGWWISDTPRPLFTPGKDPIPIVQEAGWVPGPVWTGAKNLAPTEIRFPDRPARSQSLYRLRYPAHFDCWACRYINTCFTELNWNIGYLVTVLWEFTAYVDFTVVKFIVHTQSQNICHTKCSVTSKSQTIIFTQFL